ncbi:PQ-loop domain-containing transporter [Chitinibacter sp. SCUT-21]|uniref:PQ-loop domain-containing transporter n=1 Tax=Chitinibacter sp. SCUT-21 TaxID=2970891 RepID=UPI0035A5E0BA
MKVAVNRLIVEGATLLQASVGILSMLAYLPQWKTLYQTKSSRNIALSSWAIWTASSVIASVYALVQVLEHGRGWALVFSATSNLLFVIITLLLIAKYRQPKHATPPYQISA